MRPISLLTAAQRRTITRFSLVTSLLCLSLLVALIANAAVTGYWTVALLRNGTTVAMPVTAPKAATQEAAWQYCLSRIPQSAAAATYTCQTPRYVATTSVDPPPLTAPVVTLTSSVANVVTASWPAVPNATAYQIRQCFSAGCTPAALPAPITTNFITYTLNADVTLYRFQACSVNGTNTACPAVVAEVAVKQPSPVPVDCVVSAFSAWTGGAWGACTSGSQTRAETRTRTITTQPANGGAACPALTESRTATQACESPTTGWTRCAGEWGFCSFSGTRKVRYGAGTVWKELIFTGSTQCNNDVFGDPAPNVVKSCEFENTEIPPAPAPTGTATISIVTPPTTNADGSVLSDLAGYVIELGDRPNDLTQRRERFTGNGPFTVGQLATGTYYIQAKAVNAKGAESQPSNVVTKVVR